MFLGLALIAAGLWLFAPSLALVVVGAFFVYLATWHGKPKESSG